MQKFGEKKISRPQLMKRESSLLFYCCYFKNDNLKQQLHSAYIEPTYGLRSKKFI